MFIITQMLLFLLINFTGVVQTILAICGIVGNTMAALVLSSRRGGRNTFNSMCIALTFFDSLYLLGCILESVRKQFKVDSNTHISLFPYFLYPVHQFSLTGSVFLTVAISLERYFRTILLIMENYL